MDSSFKKKLNQITTGEKIHTANLYILSKMNISDIKTFKIVWPTASSQRRCDIMRELVEIAEVNFEVNFTPVFLLGLGDENAKVRIYAVNGLWENEDPSLITPLVHLLCADEAAMVRASAATALGKFIYLAELDEIPPTVVLPAKEALFEAISQPVEDVDVRRKAMESLSYLNEPNLPPIIKNAYYDKNEKMQASAIFAMGRSADKHWSSQVVAELENINDEIRFEAVRACGELELKVAVLKLIAIIEQEDDIEIKQMSIWALGRIGGQEAQEILRNCIDGDDELMAVAAEDALDELLFLGDFGDGDEF